MQEETGPPVAQHSAIQQAQHGYRCDACGNRTRFDVYENKRSKVFRHYSLGGELTETNEEVIDLQIEKVVCRWCGSADSIRTADPLDGEAPQGSPDPA
ncbi:MAG: hypothetical protein ABR507_05985 [Actinomycetota bacterium]|nr:hypothetical protein [Actinomycetota bacterium]